MQPRALLTITQTELAQMANLGLSTVVDFERERREVSNDAIEAMRRAFEAKASNSRMKTKPVRCSPSSKTADEEKPFTGGKPCLVHAAI